MFKGRQTSGYCVTPYRGIMGFQLGPGNTGPGSGRQTMII